MSTPSSQPAAQSASKSVRVPPELHARLDRLASHLNGTMADAVAWLMDPNMVRIAVSAERGRRWKEAANANGMTVADFIIARVEAAIEYGADPGALRRIHDMVHALVKAHDIIPQQSTPGADRQTISVPPIHGSRPREQ